MRVGKCIKSESVFAALITCCFIAGGLFMLARHEMWRDELEPWMIGRYSSSMLDLIRNMRYEGHPPLWYMLLYGITRLSIKPIAVQYAHLLIAASAIYLFARFSPLPRKWKALFSFGFYPFYQYAIVCRGYAVCTLLLFVFCMLYKDRQRHFPYMVVVLFLLATADVYGWFFSVALSAATAYAWLLDNRSGDKWRTGIVGVLGGFAIVGVGMLISMLWCAPPKDGGWFTAWVLTPNFERLVLTIYGFVFELNFGPPIIYLPFSLASLLIATLTFSRKRRVAVAWLLFNLSLFVFYYVKFLPRFWHKGMVIIFIAGCAWLALYENDKPFRWNWLEKLTLFGSRCFAPMVTIVLVFYVIYGMKWIVGDFRGPYSAAEPVACYIKSNSLQGLTIVGDPDFSTQGVAAYLGKPIYYPAGNTFGRYVVWSNRRHWPLHKGELAHDVSSLARKQKDDMLLIVGYELPSVERAKLDAKLLVAYPKTVKSEEEMWLYRVPAKAASN